MLDLMFTGPHVQAWTSWGLHEEVLDSLPTIRPMLLALDTEIQ
eukprot:gene10038-1811_t